MMESTSQVTLLTSDFGSPVELTEAPKIEEQEPPVVRAVDLPEYRRRTCKSAACIMPTSIIIPIAVFFLSGLYVNGQDMPLEWKVIIPSSCVVLSVVLIAGIFMAMQKQCPEHFARY